MEQGVIQSAHMGGGIISRPGNRDVNYTQEHILSKDRNGMKCGDRVWFEIQHRHDVFTAINIRKCH